MSNHSMSWRQPRARGGRGTRNIVGLATGAVSPAYAGVEATARESRMSATRQPRVCGGRGNQQKLEGVCYESAPRMRG